MSLKRSIDGEREGWGGGLVKWVDRWPQVYQLLLSQPFLAIIKRALFGLACVACLAVQGGHAKGRGGLLFFSLIVRPRHFFFCPPHPPPPKKNGVCYSVYDWLRWGDLLFRVYARVEARNEPAGDGPGAGVRSCYTGSSIMSSKMFKRRHLRKFQTMISSSIRKTTLWASLTIRRTDVHLDSCSLTIAHVLFPGYHCSLLSFGACQSDGCAAELTVKWRSTDRSLSFVRTLLLEPR